jgi:hypothetical protein
MPDKSNSGKPSATQASGAVGVIVEDFSPEADVSERLGRERALIRRWAGAPDDVRPCSPPTWISKPRRTDLHPSLRGVEPLRVR